MALDTATGAVQTPAGPVRNTYCAWVSDGMGFVTKTTPASPRAFTASPADIPALCDGVNVTGADQEPPLGRLADCTMLRAPSHSAHAAVTFPLPSTPTGTKPRFEGAPASGPEASVETLQDDDPAGRTAT